MKIEKEIKKIIEEIEEQLKLLEENIKNTIFLFSNIYNKIKNLEKILKSKTKND